MSSQPEDNGATGAGSSLSAAPLRAKFLGLDIPWAMAALGALVLMVGYLNLATFGVFFKPVMNEFGWSRGAVGAAYTVRSVVGLLVLPFGYLADRHGQRWLILPGFILLGVCFLANSRIEALWQLYLVQAGMGLGSVFPFVCVMSTVARWHDRRRGLALGVCAAGIGLSSVIFAPVAAKLIVSYGWRTASVVLGIVTFVVAIPAVLAMKDPPSLKTSASQAAKEVSGFERMKAMPRLLTNPLVVAMLFPFFLMNTTASLVTNHLVNYATDIGISTLAAAAMVSVAGIAGTLGRLGMGAFSDRTGAKIDLVICCSLASAGVILLLFPVPGLLWVGALLFGVGYGGMVPLITATASEYFGTGQLATMTSVITFATVSGVALGPWLGGFMFDAWNSYKVAFSVAASFAGIALLLALRLPRRKSG